MALFVPFCPCPVLSLFVPFCPFLSLSICVPFCPCPVLSLFVPVPFCPFVVPFCPFLSLGWPSDRRMWLTPVTNSVISSVIAADIISKHQEGPHPSGVTGAGAHIAVDVWKTGKTSHAVRVQGCQSDHIILRRKKIKFIQQNSTRDLAVSLHPHLSLFDTLYSYPTSHDVDTGT